MEVVGFLFSETIKLGAQEFEGDEAQGERLMKSKRGLTAKELQVESTL